MEYVQVPLLVAILSSLKKSLGVSKEKGAGETSPVKKQI